MSTINEMLTAVIAARKDTLEALRGRIGKLLEPIPVGVVLSDEAGEVCRITRTYCGGSQWGNRDWDVTITGTGAIVGGKLLCQIELAETYFDGNNMHYRRTALRQGDCGSDYELKPALAFLPGKETRAIAERLPAAIERYMAKCEGEAALNAATLS